MGGGKAQFGAPACYTLSAHFHSVPCPRAALPRNLKSCTSFSGITHPKPSWAARPEATPCSVASTVNICGLTKIIPHSVGWFPGGLVVRLGPSLAQGQLSHSCDAAGHLWSWGLGHGLWAVASTRSPGQALPLTAPPAQACPSLPQGRCTHSVPLPPPALVRGAFFSQ